jgi:hypothetical protein
MSTAPQEIAMLDFPKRVARWHRALAIARILMHEEGYDTTYLDDLEDYASVTYSAPATPSQQPTTLQVTRYPHSRFWAVYEDGQLLCVTVYKKGALAVMRRLQQARRRP